MSRPLSGGSEYVLKALEEGRLDNEAGGFKRRLAKILHNERPNLFESIEQVRNFIRIHTGNFGESVRKASKNKKHYNTQEYTFQVPKHEYETPKVVVISKEVERIGIISDIHLPFQCEQTIATAYKDFKESGIGALVLNGDTLDCSDISSHDKDGTSADWSFELDTLYEFLGFTRDLFPDIPIYYKIGNHEHRLARLIWNKVPAMAREIDFSEMANLRDFNVSHVGTNDRIKFADLNIFHGHEFRISAAMHPARSLFLRVHGQEHMVIGHLHTTDTFQKGNSRRASVLGCACKLQATYDASSDYRWNNGYAKATRTDDGHTLENIRL